MLDRSPRRSVSNFKDFVGGGSVNIAVPLVSAKISGDKKTNTSATCNGSIATQAVDWRQRFALNERVESRGLHYHASTQNLPMIAGGRSNSNNDDGRQFKIKK